MGWRTWPGSSSQPSSSEGVGMMSGELSSITTNMGLEKTQFMVNMLNLPLVLAALVGTFWHSSFWTVSHCLSCTLEHSFLGTWRHSLPAFRIDSKWLSVSSTEKQKMINLWMLVVSWTVVIKNLFLHLASDLLLGSWLRMVVKTEKQNKKINFAYFKVFNF